MMPRALNSSRRPGFVTRSTIAFTSSASFVGSIRSAASPDDLWQGTPIGANDRGARLECFQDRKSKALICRWKDERLALGIKACEILIGYPRSPNDAILDHTELYKRKLRRLAIRSHRSMNRLINVQC